MTTFKKLNLKSQRICLFIILLLFQGCQAQDKKNEKDIGEIQKNTPSGTDKISYTGIVDFRYAAKMATPGVVNVKCSFKSKPHF